MGVGIELVEFDKLMAQSRIVPIVLNDIVENSVEEKDQLNALIYTKYSGDLLSNTPSCEGGHTMGEFNLNIMCEKCHTPVVRPQGNLEPLVWLRAPTGVLALINPTIWLMLRDHFTVSGFSVMNWLTDTSYRPEVKTPPVMELIENFGFKRSYNYFVENFDYVLDILFNLRAFKPKKDKVNSLQLLIQKYRDRIFSRYIPVLNKTLMVVEENNSGTYIDPTITGGIDAVRMFVGIDSALSNFSTKQKENRTIKSIDKLADFYVEMYKNNLAQKGGIYRKHVFGTRSHFSFRGVISSITDPHEYDEIHIPWGIATSVLKLHVINKLLRRGYTPNQATGFLYAHAARYHPLLDEIFQELIRETPNKGIPCILQRNPSLERGSAQKLRITKVKTDTDIPTISLSILIVRAYNADFDGDALNGTLTLDNHTEACFEGLKPHKSTFNLDTYRSVSDALSMPKPVISTMANWLDTE